jgi:hypothetical protein
MSVAIPRRPGATTTSRPAIAQMAAIVAMAAFAALEFAAAGTVPGPGQGLRRNSAP